MYTALTDLIGFLQGSASLQHVQQLGVRISQNGDQQLRRCCKGGRVADGLT